MVQSPLPASNRGVFNVVNVIEIEEKTIQRE